MSPFVPRCPICGGHCDRSEPGAPWSCMDSECGWQELEGEHEEDGPVWIGNPDYQAPVRQLHTLGTW